MFLQNFIHIIQTYCQIIFRHYHLTNPYFTKLNNIMQPYIINNASKYILTIRTSNIAILLATMSLVIMITSIISSTSTNLNHPKIKFQSLYQPSLLANYVISNHMSKSIYIILYQHLLIHLQYSFNHQSLLLITSNYLTIWP
jgi:hypothetical protein